LGGAITEQVADPGRVNVLAFPLLGIVAWNLLVYLWLLLQALRRAVAPGSGVEAAAVGEAAAAGETPARPGAAAARRDAGLLRSALLRLATRAAGPARGVLAAPLAAFVADWSRAVAPLARARAARILHLAAALFALGALAGLYLRGLVLDYRIGWESTFLDAAAVRALLAAVLGPAAALLGLPFPDIAGVAAIRFPAGAAGPAAATWIHLHALTVLLAVILPRLVLAAFALWRESRLAAQVPLGLETPYFRRLLGPFLRGESRLRVVPFSYHVDEAATAGLREVARTLLGDDAQLLLAASVPYGEEAHAAADLAAADGAVPLTLALFSLAATPEVENHGRFLETLRAAGGVRHGLGLLLDEGPYRRRLGAEATTRLAERRATWEAFGAARGLPVACTDLAAPDLAGLERRLAPALAGPPA
ncbi:MAG: DUF2868 domain-containing protein, partial [Gammaproteobacteria bacterium]|nr:DUF2868 domain-containing protein [Gammaproteobacteria bacterium]